MWLIPAQEPLPTSSSSADPHQPPKEEKELDTLFVYGSLHNEQYFQILTGRTFPSRLGELLDHRRIQPKSSFAFAVPWKGSRIKGKLLTGMTPDIMQKLDEYECEGQLYHRSVALCQTDQGTVRAYVYVGDPRALRTYIKRGFSERDRIEEYVQRQVERYLENKADRCLLMDRKHLSLLVTRELLSEEIESILMQHFTEAGLPKFLIKHEIESATLPSLAWVSSDSKARNYAANYMTLAVKFMVFNQLEEHFRDDYRGFVQTPDNFYHRTISGLMAMKLMTQKKGQLLAAMEQLKVNRYSEDMKYPDYAVAAVMIARELYNRQTADHIADWLGDNRHPGVQPIGAELEFSELGRFAIKPKENQDPKYDGFNYFYDFDLMRRGWKLGAHIDDHGFLASADTRTRGFLELAFGRYKLLGDISKPATMDPWILSQMIRLGVQFMEIKPHSLHISIQTMPDQNFNKWEDPQHFACLLILGGDLQKDENGALREMRLFHEEILHPDMGVCFSRLNKHHRYPDDRTWSSVVEFQFPRLRADYDYQPLIMALKGYQTGANPYPFGGIKDCPFGSACKELQEFLLRWSEHPVMVPENSISSFLNFVERGLIEEANQSGPDYREYTISIIEIIEEQLRERNRMIKEFNERI
jgi:gamma-glutamylcyclotransferase (GGCT)/AIG2-like uncharacterized protein YtfP